MPIRLGSADQLATRADWDPGRHPRDAKGRFARRPGFKVPSSKAQVVRVKASRLRPGDNVHGWVVERVEHGNKYGSTRVHLKGGTRLLLPPGYGVFAHRSHKAPVAAMRKVYGKHLHVSDQGRGDVQRNLQDFAELPETHHKLLADHFGAFDYMPSYKNAGVWFGSGPVPDLDANADLRRVQPRGWSEGKTWQDVPGAYRPDRRELLIGTGAHGAESLAQHEGGHAVDDALGHVSLHDRDWANIIERMQTAGAAPYFMQQGNGGREETWAEAYALWLFTKDRPSKYRAIEIGYGLGIQSRDATKIGQQMIDYFDRIDQRIQDLYG